MQEFAQAKKYNRGDCPFQGYGMVRKEMGAPGFSFTAGAGLQRGDFLCGGKGLFKAWKGLPEGRGAGGTLFSAAWRQVFVRYRKIRQRRPVWQPDGSRFISFAE